MSHGSLRSSGLRRPRMLLGVVMCLALAPLLTACGSSKPSYCSKVSDLTQSIKDLGSVKVVQNGTSAVTSAVDKVKSNADATISAAKSDFPSETSALTGAVDSLATSIKQLPSSTASTLPAIPGQIAAMTSAVTNLANATKSKCS
jgi:phage-related protein